ncbi:MAG TPA: peptide-methionine (R)-S-oxide reductase, partial [Rhodocyclaceae bacterium]
MNRRQSLASLLGISLVSLGGYRWASAASKEGFVVMKSKAEWAKLLPPDSYRVLFEEGTERAGTSPLNREKRDGTYLCAACNNPLFDASKKYESGTGWPSFWEALPGALGTKTDYILLYPRTEYHCARCGGHQG